MLLWFVYVSVRLNSARLHTYIDYIPRQNDNRYTKNSGGEIRIRASDSSLVPDFFLALEKQCGSKA